MEGTEGSLVFSRAPAGLKRAGLRDFTRTLSSRLSPGRSFTCLITNDAELARLNSQFLGKDYPTDVLSFPAEDEGYLGDIAISAQRAQEQALAEGHSVEDEIRILMLHGLLHLLGFDHETDRGRMAKAERELRAELGLPTGLIERASR